MRLSVIISFIFISLPSAATVQRPEACLIEGEMFYINVYGQDSLLYGPFNMKELPLVTNRRMLNSNCFRIYRGLWTLQEGAFYLKELRTDADRRDLRADFEVLSNRSFTEQGMLADWISGTLYVGIYFHLPWQNALELALHLENGRLISIDTFGSVERPIPLAYSLQESLFLSQVSYEALTGPTHSDVFYARAFVNADGRLKSLETDMDSSSLLHKELKALLEGIDNWGPGFNQGKRVSYELSIIVGTDKRTRRQLARKLR